MCLFLAQIHSIFKTQMIQSVSFFSLVLLLNLKPVEESIQIACFTKKLKLAAKRWGGRNKFYFYE